MRRVLTRPANCYFRCQFRINRAENVEDNRGAWIPVHAFLVRENSVLIRRHHGRNVGNDGKNWRILEVFNSLNWTELSRGRTLQFFVLGFADEIPLFGFLRIRNDRATIVRSLALFSGFVRS